MTNLYLTEEERAVYEASGAKCFDEGMSEDDHGLPYFSEARRAWQHGYHQQRVVVEGRYVMGQIMAEVQP